MNNNWNFGTLKGISKLLLQFSDVLSESNHLNYNRLIDSSHSAIIKNNVIDNIVCDQTALVNSLAPQISNQINIHNVFSLKWNSLAKIEASYETPELKQLKTSLMNNEINALQTFASSLKTTHIEAPNIAFLKNMSTFNNLNINMPKGLASVVKSLHIETANRLANSENISLDLSQKQFYIESDPEERVSTTEINIICSSLQLLSGIDETDLIHFLTYLDKYPTHACNHNVGKRIDEIISEWDAIIDFDREYYYHARALKEGACPYTEAELRKAPYGITWHGRFNNVGHSHYYFSDMITGAVLEVKKHSKEKRIQIAKLNPIKKIKMIDLSQGISKPNKFLEYCRFNPDPSEYPLIKREYLIPCYVANCCNLHGIEGIKYYGSKEYKNYVSWNDSYFDIEFYEIQENI